MEKLTRIADEEAVEEVFGLREILAGVFDRIEGIRSSAFSAEGADGLKKFLNTIWHESGSDPSPRAGSSNAERLRRTIDTSVALDVCVLH